MTSLHRQIAFGVLSLAGLIATWYFNLQFMHEPGVADTQRFLRDSYATSASSSISNDVTVAAVTFLFWSFFEAKRLAMKGWWLFIPLTIAVAFACAFPLFLLLRERKLAQISLTRSGELISMSDADAITKDLLRLETLLLNPIAASRPDTLWPLFANEFIEIGKSGKLYDKDQAVEGLSSADAVRGELFDFKVSLLADNVAHVTYRAVQYADPPIHSLRSSIWRRRGIRWQIVFHQGTVTTAI